MRISKHAYGPMFDQLLGNAEKNLTKTAEAQPEPQISGMDVFSSQTMQTLENIQEDELGKIIAELEYAAGKAKVALTEPDVLKFASNAKTTNLKGKELERAAMKFCNSLQRQVAEPAGATHFDPESLHQRISSHSILSATYDTNTVNESNTSGNYMGNKMNPNTIWDSEALQRFASKKHGDEIIREARAAQEEERKLEKEAFWKELTEKLGDPNNLSKGIIKAANTTAPEPVHDPKMGSNVMSIFSDDHDFSQIPEKSTADTIKEASKNRSEKSKKAKDEWDYIKPAKKINDGFDSLFFGNNE